MDFRKNAAIYPDFNSYYRRLEQFQAGDIVEWEESSHCQHVKIVWYGMGPFEVLSVAGSDLACSCRLRQADGEGGDRPDQHDDDCGLLLHPRTLTLCNSLTGRVFTANAIHLKKIARPSHMT